MTLATRTPGKGPRGGPLGDTNAVLMASFMRFQRIPAAKDHWSPSPNHGITQRQLLSHPKLAHACFSGPPSSDPPLEDGGPRSLGPRVTGAGRRFARLPGAFQIASGVLVSNISTLETACCPAWEPSLKHDGIDVPFGSRNWDLLKFEPSGFRSFRGGSPQREESVTNVLSRDS